VPVQGYTLPCFTYIPKYSFLKIFFVLVTSGVSDVHFLISLKEHFKVLVINIMTEFDVSNDCDHEAQ
jgi:hypothetical protein